MNTRIHNSLIYYLNQKREFLIYMQIELNLMRIRNIAKSRHHSHYIVYDMRMAELNISSAIFNLVIYLSQESQRTN